MAQPDLSRMKDEEYKLLTPEQLMSYNKVLPTIDYANPYLHQEFPKAMYAFTPREGGGGGGTLKVVKVNDERELAKLTKKGDWRASPADFGLQTAPGAAEFPTADATIEIPAAA
jgi:hypothetical protein